MSAILDIIIAAIIGITICLAVKRGFVRTIMGTLSFILAVIIAFSLTPVLKAKIMESKVADEVREYASEEVEKLLEGEAEDGNYDKLFERENKSEVEAVLAEFGILQKYEDLKQKYEGWKGDTAENIKEKIVGYLSDTAISIISAVIAFLAIFLAARIVLKLIEWLLDKFFDLPVLRQANKILGAAAGIVLALFRVYVFCLIIGKILPIAEALGYDFLARANIDNTFLFKAFYSNNLLLDFLK